MPGYTARVEWKLAVGLDITDVLPDIVENLTDHHAAGAVDNAASTASVTLTVQAPTLPKATQDALRLVAVAVASAGDQQFVPVSISLTEETLASHRSDPPDWNLPPLVTTTEIAKMFGVSRQRASQWAAERPDFPQPAARTALGALYIRSQIQVWHARADMSPGRRPAPRREPT
jgi:hypothetical protein